MALNAMHKSSFMGCADKPLLRQITDTIGRSLPQAKRPRPSEATVREGQGERLHLDAGPCGQPLHRATSSGRPQAAAQEVPRLLVPSIIPHNRYSAQRQYWKQCHQNASSAKQLTKNGAHPPTAVPAAAAASFSTGFDESVLKKLHVSLTLTPLLILTLTPYKH